MSKKRPPIVTVLGHVDHGKTTLLDTLRKTRIADREAGGITQGVGASKVKSDSGNITFIDTPGHEAFSKMRERGAKIADIAILVVAADDGPMPQTKEALKYLQDSKTPFVVAFTKIDLPSANMDKALSQMEQNQVFFEGRGGDVPYVQVSSKENKGLDDLLEMINLVAEVNEITSEPQDSLQAVVIETNKDNRGPVVSAVIRNGVLKVGESVYVGEEEVRIRGLFDEQNKSVKSVNAGDPVLILGFSSLPEVGSLISSKPQKSDQNSASEGDSTEIGEDEIGVVLKVKSAGSIEAILASLPSRAKVLSAEVGDVSDSDIFLAKPANAHVFAFESKVPNKAKKLAEQEGVQIFSFKIIYKLIEKIEEILDNATTKYSAKLDILAKFPYNKLTVAGCKVTEGTLVKSDSLVLKRGDKELGKVKIKSLRSEKSEIDQAKAGQECGVLFVPQIDFEAGDQLLAIKK